MLKVEGHVKKSIKFDRSQKATSVKYEIVKSKLTSFMSGVTNQAQVTVKSEQCQKSHFSKVAHVQCQHQSIKIEKFLSKVSSLKRETFQKLLRSKVTSRYLPISDFV